HQQKPRNTAKHDSNLQFKGSSGGVVVGNQYEASYVRSPGIGVFSGFSTTWLQDDQTSSDLLGTRGRLLFHGWSCVRTPWGFSR
ncbi:hypothetical protein, partial [Mycobacterium leprae]